MSPTLDQFTVAFANFMNTGQTGPLDQFCEPDTAMAYFHIYRNGYLRSTIDALSSNYPATQSLLGIEHFREIARRFVLKFPPASGSLTGYGSKFAEFLNETDTAKRLPYLYDIATIDRAWLRVYFAPDETPVTPEQIATLLGGETENDSQKIGLCAATEVLTLNFPVLEIWQELREMGSLSQFIELEQGLQQILIWRKQSQILVRQLPLPESVFLASVKEGLNLESAAENALDQDSSFGLEVFFSNLISEGLLTAR